MFFSRKFYLAPPPPGSTSNAESGVPWDSRAGRPLRLAQARAQALGVGPGAVN